MGNVCWYKRSTRTRKGKLQCKGLTQCDTIQVEGCPGLTARGGASWDGSTPSECETAAPACQYHDTLIRSLRPVPASLVSSPLRWFSRERLTVMPCIKTPSVLEHRVM